MLSDQDIARLASDLESFQVERKESISDKSKIEEAICAFSNDLPGTGRAGVLLIGVTDKGLPANKPVTDQLLLNLANIRSDGNILPLPRLVVYKAMLAGAEIAVVEVEPSQEPPVRCRGQTHVRVGPRRGIATRDEERVLTERRRSFELSFDQRAVTGAGIDAELDLDLFRSEYLPNAVSAAVLRENHRSAPEQLAALHLASPDGVPTVAGILLLGLEPTRWIPGAYVQFLRFGGTEMTDTILDRREIKGALPQALREMETLTKAHIRVETRVTGRSTELNQPDYPIDALNQLLRNAVMHRNYETSNAPVQWYWFSDRVEIHSPGGLFGRASPESFGKPGSNDYRNPILAAGLRNLGFVQQFGLGVPLARRACRDNGNPELEFSFGASFSVIVRARP